WLIRDQRRAGIGIASLDTDHPMHTSVVDVERRRQLPPLRLAFGRGFVHRRRHQRAPDRHPFRGPSSGGAVSNSDRTALLLIAVEQAGTAPALDRAGKLPR